LVTFLAPISWAVVTPTKVAATRATPIIAKMIFVFISFSSTTYLAAGGLIVG
jgi:hypothetical protein